MTVQEVIEKSKAFELFRMPGSNQSIFPIYDNGKPTVEVFCSLMNPITKERFNFVFSPVETKQPKGTQMTTERTQELTNEIGALHQSLHASTSIDGQAKRAMLNQIKRIEALALGVEIVFPVKIPEAPPTSDISEIEPSPVLVPPLVEPVVTAAPVEVKPRPEPEPEPEPKPVHVTAKAVHATPAHKPVVKKGKH